jgi:hypothetical protein
MFLIKENGGAMRDRTADLLRARQALSQLSYNPFTYSENLRSPSTKALYQIVSIQGGKWRRLVH